MTLDFVDVVYVVRPQIVLGWIAYDIAPRGDAVPGDRDSLAIS